MDSGSRKRLRRSKDNDGCDSQDQQSNGTNIDDRKFDVPFPKNLEARFATAIFELGLKNSSPKVLMVKLFMLLLYILRFSSNNVFISFYSH